MHVSVMTRHNFFVHIRQNHKCSSTSAHKLVLPQTTPSPCSAGTSASCHAVTSRCAPFLPLSYGWLLHHLPSGCAAASHLPAPASLVAPLPHVAPSSLVILVPLVRLVVLSPIFMPPPPIRQCLHLSSCHFLSSRPYRASLRLVVT